MSATQDNWMLLKPFHTSTGDYHSLSTNWSISTLWKSFILIAEHKNIQHSYPSLRHPNISCRQMNKFHCMDHLFTYISFANQYSHHSVSCFDLWIFTAVLIWISDFQGFIIFTLRGLFGGRGAPLWPHHYLAECADLVNYGISFPHPDYHPSPCCHWQF